MDSLIDELSNLERGFESLDKSVREQLRESFQNYKNEIEEIDMIEKTRREEEALKKDFENEVMAFMEEYDILKIKYTELKRENKNLLKIIELTNDATLLQKENVSLKAAEISKVDIETLKNYQKMIQERIDLLEPIEPIKTRCFSQREHSYYCETTQITDICFKYSKVYDCPLFDELIRIISDCPIFEEKLIISDKTFAAKKNNKFVGFSSDDNNWITDVVGPWQIFTINIIQKINSKKYVVDFISIHNVSRRLELSFKSSNFLDQ